MIGPEAAAALLSALLTLLAAAALNARASARERALFLDMVKEQRDKLEALDAKYAAQQTRYDLEVQRGNRLEDDVRATQHKLTQALLALADVKRQRDDCSKRIAELEREIGELRARLETQEQRN